MTKILLTEHKMSCLRKASSPFLVLQGGLRETLSNFFSSIIVASCSDKFPTVPAVKLSQLSPQGHLVRVGASLSAPGGSRGGGGMNLNFQDKIFQDIQGKVSYLCSI